MKVVTFGECLFRVSTQKGDRLNRSSLMNFYLGGTELNLAANLTALGTPATWVSALPDGLTGELIREKISSLGVDLSACSTIPNGKPGWYLMETGASPRPDLVLHRTASSMAQEVSFPFAWEDILAGKKLFHTSGVTAGLSLTLTNELEQAMKAAHVVGALVSYDFNYRKNIWSIEEFVERQKPLVPHIDLLFCAQSDLDLFFPGKSHAEIFATTNLKLIIQTSRSADESDYGLVVLTPKEKMSSRLHKTQSVDRIGVGDSMAAGFLHAYLSGKDLQEASEWGALAGALKYGINGDMALLKAHEIEGQLKNGPRGIIR